jgi:hypothetical protein
MILYLLHYDSPIGEPQTDTTRAAYGLPPRAQPYRAHAQHYIGIATHLDARINHHRNGTGSHFTQRAVTLGIEFTLARTWEDATREDERRLKAQKNAPRYCPICHPETAYTHDINHKVIIDLSPVETPHNPAQCEEIPF